MEKNIVLDFSQEFSALLLQETDQYHNIYGSGRLIEVLPKAEYAVIIDGVWLDKDSMFNWPIQNTIYLISGDKFKEMKFRLPDEIRTSSNYIGVRYGEYAWYSAIPHKPEHNIFIVLDRSGNSIVGFRQFLDKISNCSTTFGRRYPRYPATTRFVIL